MTNDCQCVTIWPADERGSLLFNKNKTPAFGCFLQRGWGFFVYCERHLNECTFLFFMRWIDPFPSCYFVFSVLRKGIGPIAQVLYCYRYSLETFWIRFPQRPAMLWKTFSATRFFAVIKRVTTILLAFFPETGGINPRVYVRNFPCRLNECVFVWTAPWNGSLDIPVRSNAIYRFARYEKAYYKSP